MVAALALIVAWLIPLAFLYGVRALDLYRTGKFQYNIYTILWGLIAYGLAVLINSSLRSSGAISELQIVRVVAPIVEELLKAAILVYLVRRPDFNYVVDGAIYGFGAGIGFAIVENTEYVLGQPALALTLALSRVFSTNLIHATGSGLVGSALAQARDDRSLRGALTIVGGLVLAIGVHIGFNTMVSAGTFLIFAVLAGLLGAGFIVITIRLGLQVQKGWIDEKLGAGDRVTRGEAQVVRRLQSLDQVLAPLVERFGAEKAATVERFLVLQAQIGIKRKMQERTQDEKTRRSIDTEIASLRLEMDQARKRAGTYCMLFVRGIFPEDQSPVWGLIQERVNAASTGQAGGGLWDLAANRIKAPDRQGDEP
jgi:RsiW-degrading membrane proteinase PrsW (M82 family)